MILPASSSLFLNLSLCDIILLFPGYILYLFFSRQIKGEGVLGDNFTLDEPLVDGSNSSFDLSGIIIFRLVFFTCKCSKLSSKASSFISLKAGGIFLIVFEGFRSFGCSFCFDLFFSLGISS